MCTKYVHSYMDVICLSTVKEYGASEWPPPFGKMMGKKREREREENVDGDTAVSFVERKEWTSRRESKEHGEAPAPLGKTGGNLLNKHSTTDMFQLRLEDQSQRI